MDVDAEVEREISGLVAFSCGQVGAKGGADAGGATGCVGNDRVGDSPSPNVATPVFGGDEDT